MIRIYKNILLYFIIFTCLPGLFSKKSPEWNAPLKQAPELTHGVLPNGMHYYIYPHASPKGFISLRLMVNAGAAMENETNDGIAHFIEHMTFNGTKNFKPGTLIHYFQDNGMGLVTTLMLLHITFIPATKLTFLTMIMPTLLKV